MPKESLCAHELPGAKLLGRFAAGFILVTIDDTLFILDQHAVHERIRLECLLQHRLASRRPTRARLPSSLLTPADRLFLQHPGDMESFKTRACKGAIKVTERIPGPQVAMLLQHLSLCEYPFICAHGRPSICRLEPDATGRPLLTMTPNSNPSSISAGHAQ